jgi:hypothetical protein
LVQARPKNRKSGTDVTGATKKSTITLAIDEHVLTPIRNDSELQGLSINSKINAILAKYSLHDRYVERHQPVVITGKIVQFLIDSLDEEVIVEQMKTFMHDTIPTDLIEESFRPTLGNWIKYIFGGMCLYAGTFQNFRHYSDQEGCLCLVFSHNWGIKYSRILNTLFSELFEKMLNYHTSATIHPTTLILKILERNVRNND